ncbi:hypothetical protein [Leuconostoc mesenteroides]|uniref:hypothetical protein n=1 Tax=Leuconostoc mesenteroides TaxID=1245 RepID=UPI0023613F62|nr:hypothetical protein [Leuconostoc mesenteroides]
MLSNNTVKIRALLKNSSTERFEIQGIVSTIILSTLYFKHNSDIPPFLKEVFDIEYKDYVLKSRTMILARTIRFVDKLDDKATDKIRKELLKWFEDFGYDEPFSKNISRNKNAADSWMNK